MGEGRRVRNWRVRLTSLCGKMALMEFESTDMARGYLSAMIDGEGSVEFTPNYGGVKGWRRRVRICNTSPSIIESVESANRLLGLHYTKSSKGKTVSSKEIWEISYPGKSLPLLASLVSLGDEGKKEKLEAAARYKSTLVRDPITGRIAGFEIDFGEQT